MVGRLSFAAYATSHPTGHLASSRAAWLTLAAAVGSVERVVGDVQEVSVETVDVAELVVGRF